MTSAYPIDPYDDGRALLSTLPDSVQGDLEKNAEDLTHRLGRLADSEFALVMVDPEREVKMRKFACTDAGNTAQSVFYFIRNRDMLPVSTWKTAAQNLLRSALDHDLTPPKELIAAAGDEDPLPETNMVVLEKRSGCSEKEKAIYKALEREHPEMSDETKARIAKDKAKEGSDRTWHEIQLSKEGQAGIDAALDYLSEFDRMLTPWEKRKIAQEIFPKAEAAGIELPHRIAKYAGDEYADDLVQAINYRCIMCAPRAADEDMRKIAGAQRRSYVDLLRRKGSMSPEKFAHELEWLDGSTGILQNDRIPDVVLTTFAPKKTASEGKRKGRQEVVYEKPGATIRRGDVEEFAQKHPEDVRGMFGDTAASEMAKNPVGVFRSLPTPQRDMIANRISQRKGGLF